MYRKIFLKNGHVTHHVACLRSDSYLKTNFEFRFPKGIVNDPFLGKCR